MQHLHGRSWMEIQTVDLEWYSRQEIHNGTGNNKRPMGLDALLENQFAWPLSNVPEVAHTLLFYSRGATLSLFSLYGQRFPRYGLIFQNCFIWVLVWKFHIHVHSFSTPGGCNWGYFHSMHSSFWETGWFSKLLQLGMKLGLGQSSRTCAYRYNLEIELIFTLLAEVSEIQANCQNYPNFPRGRNWAYFHSMGNSFQNTGRFSKLPYLGMKLVHWTKFQKFHTYSLNYPQVSNFTPFCSMVLHFQDVGNFSFPIGHS